MSVGVVDVDDASVLVVPGVRGLVAVSSGTAHHRDRDPRDRDQPGDDPRPFTHRAPAHVC
jgi:hypothetical protein